MKKKIVAKVYPVTWSNGVITKYRAHCESTNGVKIYGYPMPTKEKAITSLLKEAKKFADAAEMCLQLKYEDVKEIR